ncbi:MAG TPA: hypothetical protein VE029_03750 [Rhizobacter sp.]|nr:hypothetical protein [Rhizobacter sp.]
MTTEEQRDAHLREALRHAPDAKVGPAPALSALILNEARAKVRSGAASARPKRLGIGRLWDWLGSPFFATGLAGVMAATLVGLMWWERPMDEALPPRPDVAATAAKASVPAPASEAASAEPVPARAPATAPAEAKKRAKAEAEAAPQFTPRQQVPAQSPVTASVPEAPARDAAPSVPAAAAPAAEPPRRGAAADAPSSSANAWAKRSGQQAADASRATGGPVAQSFREQSASGAVAEPLRERRDAFAAPTLRQLRSLVSAEPARWTWQRGDESAAHAVNDALLAWLAQLDVAAGDAWQPASSGPTPPRSLQLLRDGRVLHSFGLGADGLSWQGPDGQRQAAVPGAALQSALDRLMP